MQTNDCLEAGGGVGGSQIYTAWIVVEGSQQ